MKSEDMKRRSEDNYIPSELLAAFIEGNTTAQEELRVLETMCESAELRELLRVSQCVDADLGMVDKEVECLPVSALAANCEEENRCCLECEKYILSRAGIDFDEEQLWCEALKNGWQKKDGTALFNVGRHLESLGLVAVRRYGCTMGDISDALEAGHHIIAAVDGGELSGDIVAELREDVLFGHIPDHTVVVLSYDPIRGTVTVFDPDSRNDQDVFPVSRFIDAWNDSKNYLVTVTTKEMNSYIPKPIDISDVTLSEDLDELREAIAENAHEIWAENRMAEGWTYGPERNDELKQNPDLVPYSQLPESEKEYDRQMAMKTIKLLIKLGYDLVKRG